MAGVGKGGGPVLPLALPRGMLPPLSGRGGRAPPRPPARAPCAHQALTNCTRPAAPKGIATSSTTRTESALVGTFAPAAPSGPKELKPSSAFTIMGVPVGRRGSGR
jgi:hypothetical protein